MIEFQLEKKIKDLAYERKISIRQLCKGIEITEQGFKKSLDNGSLKIDTLQKIAGVLDVPINYFFDGVTTDNNVSLNDKDIEDIKVYCEQINCGFEPDKFEELLSYMKYYFEIYKHKDILTKRLIHDFLKTIELKGLKEYRKEQSLMMKLLEEAESKITYVKTNKKNK